MHQSRKRLLFRDNAISSPFGSFSFGHCVSHWHHQETTLKAIRFLTCSQPPQNTTRLVIRLETAFVLYEF